MKFQELLIVVLFLSSTESLGQIYLSNGTTMSIPSNATVKINTLNDSIYLAGGTVIQNDGIIDLNNVSYINDALAPIIGNGYEHFYMLNFNTNTTYPLGGLGFVIHITTELDSLSVTRRHSSQSVNGSISISRSYEVYSSGNIVNPSTIQISYNDSELNGILENQLSVAQKTPSLNWLYFIPTINTSDNISSSFAVDTLNGTYTLLDSVSWSNISIVDENNSLISIYPSLIEQGEGITISNHENKSGVLRLFNASGKLISQNKISGKNYTFMDTYLAPGMYFINYTNNSFTCTKRIIVK